MCEPGSSNSSMRSPSESAVAVIQNPHTCAKCQKVFESKRRLVPHLKFCFRANEIFRSCPHCDKAIYLGLWATHLAAHRRHTHQWCPICDKLLNRKCFDDHFARHSSPFPFTCDLCPSHFRSRRRIIVHMKLEHIGKHAPQTPRPILKEVQKKRFNCYECGRGFNRKEYVQRHLQTHLSEAEKAYKCPKCERGFGRKDSLMSHMSIHEDENGFICSICDKPFRNKRNLATHARLHSGEKGFKCEICSKRFGYQSTYRFHLINTHQKTVES